MNDVCDFCGADHVEVYSEASPKICAGCAERAVLVLRARKYPTAVSEDPNGPAPAEVARELGALPGWYVPRFAAAADAVRVFWPKRGKTMAVCQSLRKDRPRPWILYVDGHPRASYVSSRAAMLAGDRLAQRETIL
ncbi:MAG TPA: hypothetical protein VGP64_18005 [Polyangia bacterium]|jgi:hypothetical protein